MPRESLRTLAVLLALVFAPLVHAADAPQVEPCDAAYKDGIKKLNGIGPENVYVVLRRELHSGCILGPQDSTGIDPLVKQLGEAKSDAEKAELRQRLLDRVLSQFEGLASAPCEDDTPACSVDRHVERLRQLKQALNSGSVDLNDKLFQNNSWNLRVDDGVITISQVHLRVMLTNECAAGVIEKQCLDAVNVAAKLMRNSEVMFQLIVTYKQPIIDAHAQFLSERDKEWNSYLNDLTVQYPWELGWNGRLYTRGKDKKELAAFPRAPNRKWILLHPTPGFERIEVTNGRHSTQAAVFLEVVGYEGWRWRDGTATDRWGLSLATSFVETPGANAVGYGVLIRTPFRWLKNCPIGIMWRDSDLGRKANVAFTVDVAQLITQYKGSDLKDFLTPRNQ